MYLERLWLTDFRNYESLDLEFPIAGLTLVKGHNGQGKTNLIEAIGYVAGLRSFRGATPDAMVRDGADKAVVRGQGERSGRRLLIEAEIVVGGRGRVQVNRQPLRRLADAGGNLIASVFAPDDLALVKGGPAERRRYVDELLADSDPKMHSLQRDVDRILRQRNTLLRQSGGRVSPEIQATLDVWDTKLASAGELLGQARAAIVERLSPHVAETYASLVSPGHGVQRTGLTMSTEWRSEDGHKGLADELAAHRSTDVARGITTVGPHRDDLVLTVNGLPARTHASQGEQRSLALALRLAGHRLLTESAGDSPVLLLDDVFSELDEERSERLLAALPLGQSFLTTASEPPSGVVPEKTVVISEGSVR